MVLLLWYVPITINANFVTVTILKEILDGVHGCEKTPKK